MDWTLLILGAVLIGLFAYSNFSLDEKWTSATGNRAPGMKNGPVPAQQMLRGIVEAALFFSGVALMAFALMRMGTSVGYGGF